MPTMTAGDLIRTLQKYPADTPVVYDYGRTHYGNIEDAHTDTLITDGDKLRWNDEDLRLKGKLVAALVLT